MSHESIEVIAQLVEYAIGSWARTFRLAILVAALAFFVWIQRGGGGLRMSRFMREPQRGVGHGADPPEPRQ